MQKKFFVVSYDFLILITFWTRGASLSMHRRQREMHASGSMRTVKTFQFCADVPDTSPVDSAK
jgi:hypothetical protein